MADVASAPARDRAEFHRLRSEGIGGSDVAAILGLDRYRTPEQVWLEKTGQVQPIDAMTPDQERGITFEGIALEKFFKMSGVVVVRTPGRHRHAVHKFMLANIDAMVEGRPIIVEVKCPSLGMYSRIKREGLPDSWRLQMQHYMAVMAFDFAIIVIFCADRMELVHFTVERDQALIDNMIEKEAEFWMLVETMTPPPDVISEIRGQEIVVVGNVTKRSDTEFVEAISFVREAKALVKTAEQADDEAKERFIEVVGDKPGIYEVEGLGRVHYQDRAGRAGFDEKALANVKPLDRLKLLGMFDSDKYPRSLDLVLELNRAAKAGDLDLDLAQFAKTGKPYREMRAYFGRGE